MIIPSTKPCFSKKDIKAIDSKIAEILRSGRLILGPYAQKFEEEFKKYIGSRYAVAVGSCTAALEIVLRFIGVEGREVIVPTNTFVASANSVIFAGGKPVLCDINTSDLSLNMRDMKAHVTKKTKAIIIVHVAGLPFPQMDELKKFCLEKSIHLIEDVAHALGASINTKKAGSFGFAGCFSFYPTKLITTGTGGMITTDNKDLADFALSLRHHGVGKGLTDIVNLGNDWLLDEVGCAMGLQQLRSIEKFVRARRHIAEFYRESLDGEAAVELLFEPQGIRHVYYKFPLIFINSSVRNKLHDVMLKKYGISTGSIYYPPCHRQPLYRKLFSYKPCDFPVAEGVLDRILCLPIYSQMEKHEARYVLKSLNDELSKIEK